MFGFHPANLTFRLLLELAALISIGVGAYTLAGGFAAWLVATGLALLAAVVWGVFNVPGDKSRSGNAPVVVAGPVRLIIEFVVFAAAVVLVSLVSGVAAVALGAAVALHYLISIDRIRWLLTN